MSSTCGALRGLAPARTLNSRAIARPLTCAARALCAVATTRALRSIATTGTLSAGPRALRRVTSTRTLTRSGGAITDRLPLTGAISAGTTGRGSSARTARLRTVIAPVIAAGVCRCRPIIGACILALRVLIPIADRATMPGIMAPGVVATTIDIIGIA